jgi:hypothetical protein
MADLLRSGPEWPGRFGWEGATNVGNARPAGHGKAKRLTAPDGLGSDETRPDPLGTREQHAGIMAGTEIRVKPIIDTGASTI